MPKERKSKGKHREEREHFCQKSAATKNGRSIPRTRKQHPYLTKEKGRKKGKKIHPATIRRSSRMEECAADAQRGRKKTKKKKQGCIMTRSYYEGVKSQTASLHRGDL